MIQSDTEIPTPPIPLRIKKVKGENGHNLKTVPPIFILLTEHTRYVITFVPEVKAILANAPGKTW